jgi:hypothetical protein
MGKTMRLLLASAVVATLFAAAPAALASSNDVIRRGACTGSSHWRLELSTASGGRIEVDFKVVTGAVGQTWRVVERHNGVVYFRGTRVSHDSPAEIEVDNFVRNLAGTDRIRARATNAATGEVCIGTASI